MHYLNQYLKFILSLSFVFILNSCSQRNGAPPNVILILTDDQGYGDMSCHGHPILQTPNIDRLSREGVRLTDFHVDPYCAPTRAALMTGRYALRTGVWHTYGGRNWLLNDETTMAEIFKTNGYATGHFGKWHLGHNYPLAPYYRGFDESLMLGDGGLGATNDYWGNDRFDDTYFYNGQPVKTHGFGTDQFFNYALRFIERNKEKPFFIYLAPNLVHRPWNIPPEYVMKYDPTQSEPPLVVDYHHTDMSRFYGSIDKIDEQIGRLLTYLENSKLIKNTIIIFLTDNGTVSTEYNAGMRGRKGSPYDGGHRVPCFINWQEGQLKSGKDITNLTAHVDLLPTLIDLCKLNLPKEILFDGISLAPLLLSDQITWPNDRIYITQQAQSEGYKNIAPKWLSSVVLSERWRMVHGQELFDIKQDPAQENDLAQQYPDTVEWLREIYEKYWADVFPRTKKTARVTIDHDNQAETWLSLISIHQPDGSGVWSQVHAAKAITINGYWAVDIVQDGLYQFELRRWPRELNKPISARDYPFPLDYESAISIKPVTARLKIADVELSQDINPDSPAVIFNAKLTQGPANLQTWFIDQDGRSRTAYWIYIKPI